MLVFYTYISVIKLANSHLSTKRSSFLHFQDIYHLHYYYVLSLPSINIYEHLLFISGDDFYIIPIDLIFGTSQITCCMY